MHAPVSNAGIRPPPAGAVIVFTALSLAPRHAFQSCCSPTDKRHIVQREGPSFSSVQLLAPSHVAASYASSCDVGESDDQSDSDPLRAVTLSQFPLPQDHHYGEESKRFVCICLRHAVGKQLSSVLQAAIKL